VHAKNEIDPCAITRAFEPVLSQQHVIMYYALSAGASFMFVSLLVEELTNDGRGDWHRDASGTQPAAESGERVDRFAVPPVAASVVSVAAGVAVAVAPLERWSIAAPLWSACRCRCDSSPSVRFDSFGWSPRRWPLTTVPASACCTALHCSAVCQRGVGWSGVAAQQWQRSHSGSLACPPVVQHIRTHIRRFTPHHTHG